MQHDSCHALACTLPGHHGLSHEVFSACPHDDLFGWACVATTGNCNLDNASHPFFSLSATVGMAVMSVSSEWPACCILELPIPLGVAEGTAATIFVYWFQLQA
ncbi:TPA: hypothetical protein ACH3X1_006314 [Trebouxia sp. C0004]